MEPGRNAAGRHSTRSSLDGVASIPSAAAEIIDQYVNRGGRLVAFPPPNDAKPLNDSLEDLLPAKIGGRITLKTPETLRPADATSPLLRPFTGKGAAALLTTPVFAYYGITPSEDSRPTKTIFAAKNAPILVDCPIGRGRVLVFAVPLDPAWTGLPLWPSFVPLVREIVTAGAAERAVAGNALVGEPLHGVVPEIGPLRVLELERPDGRRVRLPFRTRLRRTWVDCIRHPHSGRLPSLFYTARCRRTGSTVARDARRQRFSRERAFRGAGERGLRTSRGPPGFRIVRVFLGNMAPPRRDGGPAGGNVDVDGSAERKTSPSSGGVGDVASVSGT